jgi:hypothetical protein
LAAAAVWRPVSDPEQSASVPQDIEQTIRVKVLPDDLSYEAIKSAIYEHAQDLSQSPLAMRRLLLSRDIYEILNRRLVFKTAAHKDAVHFVTPFGNLRVEQMDEALDEPLSFIIE